MVDLATKILAIVVGVWAAFASYPAINEHVVALLAFVGAIAVGIIAGAVTLYVLNWLLASLRRS